MTNILPAPQGGVEDEILSLPAFQKRNPKQWEKIVSGFHDLQNDGERGAAYIDGLTPEVLGETQRAIPADALAQKYLVHTSALRCLHEPVEGIVSSAQTALRAARKNPSIPSSEKDKGILGLMGEDARKRIGESLGFTLFGVGALAFVYFVPSYQFELQLPAPNPDALLSYKIAYIVSAIVGVGGLIAGCIFDSKRVNIKQAINLKIKEAIIHRIKTLLQNDGHNSRGSSNQEASSP